MVAGDRLVGVLTHITARPDGVPRLHVLVLPHDHLPHAQASAKPIAALAGLASRRGYARAPGGPVEPRSRRRGGWTVRRR